MFLLFFSIFKFVRIFFTNPYSNSKESLLSLFGLQTFKKGHQNSGHQDTSGSLMDGKCRKLTRWSPLWTKIRTGKSATQNSGSFYHYSHHHHHDCHSHISSSRSSWPAPPSLWSQYRWCLELFLSWFRTRRRQAAGRKQQSLKSDFLNPAQRVFFCLIPSTNHME